MGQRVCFKKNFPSNDKTDLSAVRLPLGGGGRGRRRGGEDYFTAQRTQAFEFDRRDSRGIETRARVEALFNEVGRGFTAVDRSVVGRLEVFSLVKKL